MQLLPNWIRRDRGLRFLVGAAVLLVGTVGIFAVQWLFGRIEGVQAVSVICAIVALGIWADAKGHSFVWGFTGFIWLLGLLIVLVILPDRTTSPSAPPGPAPGTPEPSPPLLPPHIPRTVPAANSRTIHSVDDDTRVRCPFCAEWILPAAKVCKHCHSRLDNPL